MNIAAPSQNHPKCRILGVEVDRLTMPECLARIQEMVNAGGPHLVVTADAAGIVQAQSDPALMDIYASADLVTPDSVGVLWAAKRKGEALPERVSGVDLLDRICDLSAQHGYRLYFLGSGPGVAELAAERLRLKHPGCNIVGTRHGFFPSDSDEVVAQEVAAFEPDFLFVAMGIPRQEKFIAATKDIVRAKVSMGVGGSFDVFSGKAKRAPKLFQNLKLEWLWRLVLNPRKISKAKNLPIFVRLVLREGK